MSICNNARGAALAELVFVVVLLAFILLTSGAIAEQALQALAHAVGWQ